jgi:hypothetical protein
MIAKCLEFGLALITKVDLFVPCGFLGQSATECRNVANARLLRVFFSRMRKRNFADESGRW